MLDSRNHLLFCIELAIAIAGLVVIYRYVLSASARVRLASPAPLPHWDIPLDAYGFAVIRFIAAFVAFQIMIVQLVEKYFPDLLATETNKLLSSTAIFQACILIGLLIAWGFMRKPIPTLNDAPPPPPPLPWRKVPLAGLATFTVLIAIVWPLMEVWQFLLTRFGVELPLQPLARIFVENDSPTALIAMLVMAVVLAPLSEELLFRAAIFRYLRNRLPRIAAYLLPAVLFSLAHFHLGSVPALIAFGLVQSFAYERTGRIAVPIIAHALFNLNTALGLINST